MVLFSRKWIKLVKFVAFCGNMQEFVVVGLIPESRICKYHDGRKKMYSPSYN